MVPIILFVFFMIIGELASIEFLIFIGIWGCIIGIMLILYGFRLRHLFFQLLIMAFIVPMPPFVNRLLTFNLKLAASTLSVQLLRITGVSVLQDGNIIDMGFTQLQVVDACSGLRYFVPLILMSLLFGYFYTNSIWKKVVLVLFVLPLSIVVNGFRIYVTGMLHVWGYPELAENFFHDFSGWIIFMIAGVILFGFSIFLRRFGKERKTDKIPDFNMSTPNQIIPVSLTIVLCLLFVTTGYAIQKIPSNGNLPDRKSFAGFPMNINEWTAKRNYLSKEILDNLWSDDYVSAVYYNDDLPNTIQLLIPFYEYQGTRHTAHAPQSCMLGSGWALIGSHDHFITSDTGEKFKIRTNTWQKGSTRILGSYFFFQRGRVITSPWMNKYWLMVDAFTKQRTDGALVRAELTLSENQSLDDGYRILEEFVGNVFKILPEYVPE